MCSDRLSDAGPHNDIDRHLGRLNMDTPSESLVDAAKLLEPAVLNSCQELPSINRLLVFVKGEVDGHSGVNINSFNPLDKGGTRRLMQLT